jgi:hypothetical protein
MTEINAHRPRPLGSPPARARTCETHPDHSNSQPSTNPTFLPPTHREQNRAYIEFSNDLLRSLTRCVRLPTDLAVQNVTGRRVWSRAALHHA